MAASALAQSNSTHDQRPDAQHYQGAAAEAGPPGKVPSVAPIAAKQPAAQSQRAQTDEERVKGYLQWFPWWFRALFKSEITNFLIMAFTGVLTWVAIKQGRLQERLAAENAESARIAKQAADAAEVSAQAALKSAAIAERSLVVERPWLFLNLVRVERRRPPPEPNEWYISFEFENVGRSPAIIDKCEVVIVDQLELPLRPDYSKGFTVGAPMSIAAGKSFETNQVGPSIKVGPDGLQIMYVVYGRISYRDLAGAPHQTGFAVSVSPNIPAFGALNIEGYGLYD